MMANTRKTVKIALEVSVPVWMTAAQARKEVRTRINMLCEYGFYPPNGTWGDTAEVRAKKVAPGS